MAEGMSEAEARRRCWFFDSKGLVVAARSDLAEHKRPFAHEHEFFGDFSIAIEAVRPTVLLGVSGMPAAFTPSVLQVMAAINERPVIFALSNPTSRSECTAQQAYGLTLGQAVFASGSPFDPVDFGGRTYVPGQANNAYIFPGVGLGVIASEARRVTDEMFFAAAKALAAEVTRADLDLGRIYPPLTRIRDVSARIAVAVAEVAYERDLARAPRPADLLAYVRSHMYEPVYEEYV
jgi:malate dehydrogenase (oxaloacetate-decarboxylating)(NADP+)